MMSGSSDIDGVAGQPDTTVDLTMTSPVLPPVNQHSFAWGELLADTSSTSCHPQPTSEPASSESVLLYGILSAEEKRRLQQETCATDPTYARAILDRIGVREREGWCVLVDRQPTKDKGYVQLSTQGANHFAVLQEVVLWAQGEVKGQGEQCSHLCHQPLCKTVGHVTPESVAANNARKGCLVWIRCPHCPDMKILVCRHEPTCIRFVEGYSDMSDFIARGVCGREPV